MRAVRKGPAYCLPILVSPPLPPLPRTEGHYKVMFLRGALGFFPFLIEQTRTQHELSPPYQQRLALICNWHQWKINFAAKCGLLRKSFWNMYNIVRNLDLKNLLSVQKSSFDAEMYVQCTKKIEFS